MNRNPFYVHPGTDYGPAMQGLAGTAIAVGDKWKEEERLEEAARKTAEIRLEAQQAYKTGDPDKIWEVAVKYPELSQAVNMAMQFQNERTKNNYVNSIISALQNPNSINEVITARQQFLEEQGVAPENRTETDTFLERFQEDPEAMQKHLEMELALRAPDKYKQYKAAKYDDPNKLTAKRQDYEFAKEQGFEGSFLEYQKAIANLRDADTDKTTADMKNFKKYQELKKANPEAAEEFARQLGIEQDPKTELEMTKLQAQILDIQGKMGAREGEEARRVRTEKKKIKNLVSGIDSVLGEIDSAINEAKESWSATGIPGAVTGVIPSTPAYNLRKRIDVVKANIGFDKLQAMRDASPTGGALGQVSERELNFLQQTISALDPKMGDDLLIPALEKVQKHYENWKKTLEGEMPEDYANKSYSEIMGLPTVSTKEKPIELMNEEELRKAAGLGGS